MSESGATIVAVKARDGVVISGDRKVTYGTLILSRGAKKVHLLSNRVAVGFSGIIADAQSILRLLQEEMRYYRLAAKTEMSIESIAKLLSVVLYSQKYYPVTSEVIVAGIDNEPKIIVLDSLGSTLADEYAAIGTGAPIAYGVLEEGYSKDLSLEEAKKLVISAIKSSLKRDALSGGAIDIISIPIRGEPEEQVIEEKGIS